MSAKNEVSAAISLLGNSDWYQSGHMHAESLMNELSRLQVELAEKDETIAELREEVALRSSGQDAVNELLEAQMQLNGYLRERCEAVERDAERYRWIRENKFFRFIGEYGGHKSMDEIIDDALAAQRVASEKAELPADPDDYV